MRAVQIERFGAPEVLEVAKVLSPEPQGDEVLLEVEAAGVNRADLLTRAGLYHRAGHPPLVPGFEGSGVVREVGDSAERFAPGDRVFAFGDAPASTPSGSRYRRSVSSGCRKAWTSPARPRCQRRRYPRGTASNTSPVSGPARRYLSTLPPAALATLRCRSRSSRARRCSLSPDHRRRWPGPCKTAPITA